MATYRRSWKNYLINARMQLHFTFLMVAICAVLMGALGALVMRRAHFATIVGVQQVQGNREFLKDPDAAIRELYDRELAIRRLLVTVGLGLSIGLFLYGIKMTHRIAGPLYKVGKHCEDVASGKLVRLPGLRKGDVLGDFYAHFSDAHESLRAWEQEDVASLKRILAAASGLPEAQIVELRALLAAKEAALA